MSIGVLLWELPSLKMILDGDSKPKILIPLSITGVLLIIASLLLIIYMNKQHDEAIHNEVAVILNTTPEKIIISDLKEVSDGLFFRTTKNENLKEVVHEGKAYRILVDGGKLEGIVEIPITDSDALPSDN